eukprot:CAMPEP_0171841098 /NCGR_PEP_ID=MMETSP0992-20121227/14364_1 /TAXON_ID=483369 /ORGANISM="non described non described, Strain CCMP2098" /LENGTH=248 /DNA_ID=CAMNT_0012458023 /DNA_START=179 /DNA_END=925 /DNA_ORIENTATION=+
MNGTQIATRCTDLDCDESDEDNKESELWKQTRLEATKKPRPSVRYFAVVAGIQLRDEEHQEAKTQKRQQQGGREAAGCAVGGREAAGCAVGGREAAGCAVENAASAAGSSSSSSSSSDEEEADSAENAASAAASSSSSTMAEPGVGPKRVRGGTYTARNLSENSLDVIAQETRHAQELCLNCGAEGHMVSACSAPRRVQNTARDLGEAKSTLTSIVGALRELEAGSMDQDGVLAVMNENAAALQRLGV